MRSSFASAAAAARGNPAAAAPDGTQPPSFAARSGARYWWLTYATATSLAATSRARLTSVRSCAVERRVGPTSRLAAAPCTQQHQHFAFSLGHAEPAPSCAHRPAAVASQFYDDATVEKFIARFCRDVETVVFHCYLSQQRGPFCAQRWVGSGPVGWGGRERKRRRAVLAPTCLPAACHRPVVSTLPPLPSPSTKPPPHRPHLQAGRAAGGAGLLAARGVRDGGRLEALPAGAGGG